MSCHVPVQLPVHSREVEAISWSEDQRIAVTSSQNVYVLTLKGGHCSPSTSLPVSISRAAAPPFRENPAPDTPMAAVYDPTRDKLDFSLYLDPMTIPNHTPIGYRESGWSPAGCDVIGGCLLSVLTIGGQLWLLTPPGCQTMQWQISTNLNSDTRFAACTTFHWLPWIIPTQRGGGGVAVVAMATRSGHIGLLAMEVPVHRGRAPKLHVLLDEEISIGDGWPCRLRWTHTPSPNAMSHLAVGMTGGQCVVLSWSLPAVWRGAGETLAHPELMTVWKKKDDMAVRHIEWQCPHLPSEQLWLVFNKASTLVAVLLEDTPTPPQHVTIYGVHSRSVSGLTALPNCQFISCSLDGSVQTFQLHQSCDSHVTPTPVTMETVSGGCTANGVVISEHGLYIALLTSMSGPSSSTAKHKLCSQLHCSSLLPLSLLDLHNVNFSWDISEAVRMHTVAKQPLPGNVQEILTSQQSSWQQLSSMLRRCVQSHTREFVTCDDGDDGAGGGGVMSGSGDGGDMCAAVMMEYVCKVLSECAQEVGGDSAATSLYIMSQWVESSSLATPPQQLMANMTLGGLQRERHTESCPICSTPVSFTHYRREMCVNGHSWERCCKTLLLATSSYCGCCRGCGATAHNLTSLQATPASWFEQLLSNGQCTYCQNFFDLVT